MKRVVLVLLLVFQVSHSQAATLRSFLRSCAWGTMAGATAGVVSLAFTDKPGDSWNNVAKGASLGLYAGIGYGLYKMNKDAEPAPSYSVAPQFSSTGAVEGVRVAGTVFEF